MDWMIKWDRLDLDGDNSEPLEKMLPILESFFQSVISGSRHHSTHAWPLAVKLDPYLTYPFWCFCLQQVNLNDLIKPFGL